MLKEKLLYPGKANLCTYTSEGQNYHLPDGTRIVSKINGNKFTREIRFIDKSGYTMSRQTPVKPDASAMIAEGPYQEFDKGKITLEGWCVVDFEKNIEHIYADRECTALSITRRFDPVDHSTTFETGYFAENDNGTRSVRYMIPYANHLPDGVGSYYHDHEGDGAGVLALQNVFQKGCLKEVLHYATDGHIVQSVDVVDPMEKSYQQSFFEQENTIISVFKKGIQVKGQKLDIHGRVLTEKSMNAAGQLVTLEVTEYQPDTEQTADWANMRYYEVDTTNDNGQSTGGVMTEFVQNANGEADVLAEGRFFVTKDQKVGMHGPVLVKDVGIRFYENGDFIREEKKPVKQVNLGLILAD